MARVEYQASLEALEADLQEQGGVVLRAVAGAINALETQDVELCDEVIAFDDEIDDRVKHALERAALWNEVSHRLKESALGLSGGQQQRLCIARALAVEPDVILMDEPASALDPISTSRIEDLIHELKREYTIVIVTHNMQQAARVADMTAFFSVEVREDGTGRHGTLVEYDQTTKIFTNPSDRRTEDYVTGRFG